MERNSSRRSDSRFGDAAVGSDRQISNLIDRKSTRLNSSHPSTSYAVFCLRKTLPHECAAMLTRMRYYVDARAPELAGCIVYSCHDQHDPGLATSNTPAAVGPRVRPVEVTV